MGHIGLYDSGIGGLTVLKALLAKYPGHTYTYVGDNKYAPYGSKTEAELWKRNQFIIDFLINKGVDEIVIACNTSTALFLEKIKAYAGPTITITSIIAPACKAAVTASHNKTIAVLATEQTIKSKIYSTSILEINAHQTVIEIPCPELVPLIEAGQLDNPLHLDTLTKGLKKALKEGADTIIYGCTHYPLLNQLWQSKLKNNETLINPATTVSIQNPSTNKNRTISLFCSGSERPFEKMLTSYLTQTDILILSMPH